MAGVSQINANRPPSSRPLEIVGVSLRHGREFTDPERRVQLPVL
jgi:hypothetical protein